MSLPDYALTDVSTIQNELNISGSSSIIERYIKEYSDLFRRATDREFYYKSNHKEDVSSNGDTLLLVNDHRPIDTINSITDPDGNTIDSSNYEIHNSKRGEIRLKDNFWENTGVGIHDLRSYIKYYEDLFTIDYDGGYNTPPQSSPGPYDLPASIQGAVIQTVATRKLSQGKPGNIQSESLGEASITYISPSNMETVLGSQVTSSFHYQVKRWRNRSVI